MQALAHFVRNEGSERILVLPQGLAVEADDFSALWGGHVTPGLAGFGRGCNDLFVIIGRTHARGTNGVPVHGAGADNLGSDGRRGLTDLDTGIGVAESKLVEMGLHVHGGGIASRRYVAVLPPPDFLYLVENQWFVFCRELD